MKKVVIFLVIASACSSLYAQYGGLAGFTYCTSQTMGETKEWIQDYSWRGFAVQYNHFRSAKTSLGFETGWNVFGQRVDGVVSLPNGAISGTQIREFSAIPILVTGNYHFKSLWEEVSPYIAIGLGGYYITDKLSAGIFALQTDNLHFGVAPELGFYIPAGDGFLKLALKYNRAVPAGESTVGDKRGFSFLGLNVGLAFSTF
ncbi:hypothetical protein EH223_11245 [candidate division KSB1 bacterium]|nr:hypothetical protein [candidate division KSB1 bacterium]RQW03014.1 MAG: hypothetical protein EH223_11245 [candidate division KSB1 bacterium]